MLKIVIWLLFAHWIADFVLQSNWMATNKSKNNRALGFHCMVYAYTMAVFFSMVTRDLKSTVIFGLLMFITHVIVDYVTSRIKARLFKPWYDYHRNHPCDVGPDLGGDVPTLHNFFVSVGFDQFIHYVTIIWACRLLHVL